MMLKVGLTGGIGSGKSIISRVFGILGAPVFNADFEAKMLMESEPGVREKIRLEFGQDIYTSGRLDRKRLASLVFGNQDLLAKLNGIVHPAVGELFRKWVKSKEGVPYIIKEAAILFESGGYRELDHVVLVSAPPGLRISRVMERDGVDRESVEQRMANQWPDERKRELADTILVNDGNNPVLQTLLKLDAKFRKGDA